MRRALDEQLCREHPALYGDRHADMRGTCMCWGFPGDGWFELLRGLSQQLDKLIQCEPEESREHYRAMQVKEKFGGLRFYMVSSTDAMEDLIEEAESQSYKTCEECGQPGKLRKGGWYVTLCDTCKMEAYPPPKTPLLLTAGTL